MDAILSRRSIRKYTAQPVSDHLIKELLEAAMSAPSAGNEQPWHFVVITDRQILDEIPTCHPYSQMIREASVAILVCCDLQLDTHDGLWVQDCAAATENLLIAVQAQGLGAVWLGVYPREQRITGLRKLLGIPEHVVPFSLISLGYPAEQKPRANRYDNSKIHDNSW
ncbi:MAG: nitroreductase family protein [Thermodesulfobacteriota bacterium]